MRYLLTLLLLSCAPSVGPKAPVVVTPPVVDTPVIVPTPTPTPVEDKALTRLNSLGECELLYRPDNLVEGRYWLYTENCNKYYTLKWFENIESKTSLSYIGLVGYDSQVYIDTNMKHAPLIIKAVEGSSTDSYSDEKLNFIDVYRVKFMK